MDAKITSFFQHELTKQCLAYLAKATIVFALIFLLGRYAPSMPTFGIAALWAILSVVSAIGIAYHLVIRKALRQSMLKSEKLFAKVNSGRIFGIVIAFVASAVLAAGLIMESPQWGTVEWIMLACAIPVYFVVYLIMRKVCAGQYEPLYQTSFAIKISILITGALLCVVYLAIYMNEPAVHYTTTTEAFMNTRQPFEGSPSILLSETGMVIALFDSLTAYGMSQVAEFSFQGFLVWKVVICASAFFGFANLIGACVLKFDDLKLVFSPLDVVKSPDAKPTFTRRYLITACILPVLLTAGFLYADAQYAKVAETEEYTAIQSFVRDQAGFAAYLFDGKYYDKQKVDELRAETFKASQALSEERERVLVPLINESFDKRIENVDSYLDWYYSLPADYNRLIQFFTGKLEDSMKQQLEDRINEGVDDTELDEQFEYYLEQSEKLTSDFKAKIAEYEIADVPDWLVVSEGSIDADALFEPIEPSQRFLTESERFGISAGTGVAAGFISAKVTSKILAKPFFKKIVAEISSKLAVRGMLAEGGTIVAPGVGTAIGVGVGIFTDYLFLKSDEAMNRESYKEEIVAAIEEQRAEMLELVQASS